MIPQIPWASITRRRLGVWVQCRFLGVPGAIGLPWTGERRCLPDGPLPHPLLSLRPASPPMLPQAARAPSPAPLVTNNMFGWVTIDLHTNYHSICPAHGCWFGNSYFTTSSRGLVVTFVCCQILFWNKANQVQKIAYIYIYIYISNICILSLLILVILLYMYIYIYVFITYIYI